jgi:hypothetical protein
MLKHLETKTFPPTPRVCPPIHLVHLAPPQLIVVVLLLEMAMEELEVVVVVVVGVYQFKMANKLRFIYLLALLLS